MHRRVLIIDDCKEQRDVFARYLKFVGEETLEAENGLEGYERARNDLPDLVLLDLAMPVMNGWETIQHLKSDPATARIPVIALTARHLEWDRLEAAGFCSYLEKPIVPFKVMQEVESCVGDLGGRTYFRSGSQLVEHSPSV
ncbi:MAG TPA: response regulator [Longimicrobiaceae bacterium]|nr:response regulator [Longimicrobiaceae bacterium]